MGYYIFGREELKEVSSWRKALNNEEFESGPEGMMTKTSSGIISRGGWNALFLL